MAFPYNNAIPQGTDIPAQSQPLMLQNFASIDLELQVDHISFAGGPAGAHNKVSFVNGAATAWPAGVQFGLYATAAVIFVHNAPAGIDSNVTLRIHTVAAPADYWTIVLPSGLIILTGIVTMPAIPGTITVPFTAFPTGVISAQVSVMDTPVGPNYFAWVRQLHNAPVANISINITAWGPSPAAYAPAGTQAYFTVIGY